MSQSSATFPPSLSSLLKSVPRKPDVRLAEFVSPTQEPKLSVSGFGTSLAGDKQLRLVDNVENIWERF